MALWLYKIVTQSYKAKLTSPFHLYNNINLQADYFPFFFLRWSPAVDIQVWIGEENETRREQKWDRDREAKERYMHACMHGTGRVSDTDTLHGHPALSLPD